MNILIVDPSRLHCNCAVSALVTYGGANTVVTAQRMEEIVGCYRIARVGLCYDLALFRIPSIRWRKNGDIQPQSQRAEIMLDVVKAVDRAGIQHVVFSRPFPIAFYQIGTDEIVPIEMAFYRRMNWDTETFEGCYIAPNWRWLVDRLKEATVRETYLDFPSFLE